MYNRNIIKLRYHKKGNNVMNILGNEKYEANVKNVITETKEFETKTYKDFTFYTLDGIYVISYFSSYKASSRSKVYKTYSVSLATWSAIVSEVIDHTNF